MEGRQPSEMADTSKHKTGPVHPSTSTTKHQPTNSNVSQAMLKAAKNLQEKMRKKEWKSKPEPKRKRHSKRPDKTEPLIKGKSYTSRSDRQPREKNLKKHRERNFIFDTKIGGRNPKSGFKFRKNYTIGTTSRRRVDRIYSTGGDSEQE